jgi:hypothetical protein
MYKKFLLKTALLVIPFALIIFIVNIKVDSGFVFNNRSSQLAKILVSGRNAGILDLPSTSSWGGIQIAIVNERLKLKKNCVKDILVFGTSRSSEINSAIFPHNSFFNCVMTGGNILDYIALYGLYKQSKILPKYLIISIDPWSFHSRKGIIVNKEIQYISDPTIPLKINPDLVNDYYTGLDFMGIHYAKTFGLNNQTQLFDNIIELFNPNYFQLNLPSLFRKTVIETDHLSLNSYFVIRSDGGYSLAQQSQIDSVSVKDKSYNFVNMAKANFFISLDTSTFYWAYFKQLLISIKKDGIVPIVEKSLILTTSRRNKKTTPWSE